LIIDINKHFKKKKEKSKNTKKIEIKRMEIAIEVAERIQEDKEELENIDRIEEEEKM